MQLTVDQKTVKNAVKNTVKNAVKITVTVYQNTALLVSVENTDNEC